MTFSGIEQIEEKMEDKQATLTKAHIVEKLYFYLRHLDLSKPDCIRILDALFEQIKQSLVEGEDVLISGFGKFCVKQKHSRRGRNPQTGEKITLEPRRVVTFKWSNRLKEQINKTEEERRERLGKKW